MNNADQQAISMEMNRKGTIAGFVHLYANTLPSFPVRVYFKSILPLANLSFLFRV
jgi:hypothetical protein